MKNRKIEKIINEINTGFIFLSNRIDSIYENISEIESKIENLEKEIREVNQNEKKK